MRATCRFLLLAAAAIGSLASPAAFGAEKFTIAVVPDTQQETVRDTGRFEGRMQWLADNRGPLNLQFVLHSGDMANWDTPDHDQFARASTGLEILDKARIPYAIALGNHDTAAVKEGGSAIQQNNGGYGDNSPQYVFDNLLKLYPNVRLVFSGHTGSHGYRADQGANGNTIYQFLQCYHDNATNPTRLLEIDPDNGTMKSRVHCPSTGEDKADGSSFTVTGVQWVPK